MLKPTATTLDLVAAKGAQNAVRIAGGDGKPVRVGVVGEDQVGPFPLGEGEGKVEGARLLGVRKADGREGPVRLTLLRHLVDLEEARLLALGARAVVPCQRHLERVERDALRRHHPRGRQGDRRGGLPPT